MGKQISQLVFVIPTRILGSIQIKWGSNLNEIDYCENTLGKG